MMKFLRILLGLSVISLDSQAATPGGDLPADLANSDGAAQGNSQAATPGGDLPANLAASGGAPQGHPAPLTEIELRLAASLAQWQEARRERCQERRRNGGRHVVRGAKKGGGMAGGHVVRGAKKERE